MRTAHDAAIALARRYSFGDVAALVSAGLVRPPEGRAARLEPLCVFGQRLLDLDAEDFGVLEHDDLGRPTVPRGLVARSRECRMPQTPREQPRGALASLRPAFRLLLEVIEARWHRRDMAALVAVVHIAAEYLPLLAWEPVLGHAGDPALLEESVGGPGSRFGDQDDRACAHRRNDASAASRALRVAGEPPSGWQAYLDRQHSNMAHALATCAAECREPCTVMARHDDATRATLAWRCEIALALQGSAIVRLRHAAPVGHGFGVPSPEEVLDAWERTRDSLALRGVDGLADPDGGAFPAPGLSRLFSAVAGVELTPDTLLADTAEVVVDCLEGPGSRLVG
ncbi:MAG TPA: hypothetical protein VGL93_02110 [Streptosporangiaceae bacterium]|jgi:hypothetical protein